MTAFVHPGQVTATLDTAAPPVLQAVPILGVSGAGLAWATPSHPVSPQGRLTLSPGEPVMTADQTGKTSIFYTPYVGASVPIYDGTAFVPTPFAERSNDLTQTRCR